MVLGNAAPTHSSVPEREVPGRRGSALGQVQRKVKVRQATSEMCYLEIESCEMCRLETQIILKHSAFSDSTKP